MAFKFNGIDLYATYGFALENKIIPTPRIRRSTATRPGVDGVLDFGGVYEEREIAVRGSMINVIDHDTLIEKIRELASAIGAVPHGRGMAPLFGQPISVTSVNGTIEFDDFPNIVYNVTWNGTFDVVFTGRSGYADAAIVTIGFRQINPWATSTTDFYHEGATDADGGHFWALNDNGMYVPPNILFTGQTADVTRIDLTSHALDPLNTRAITGTVLGSPVFNSHADNSAVIVGGFNFATDTAAITFPVNGNFSQEQGTVELVYMPSGLPSLVSGTLWTLYVDADNYWQCWYDDSDNRFKFTMALGGSATTINSGVGYTLANSLNRVVVSWDEIDAYIAVNDGTRVSDTKVKIAYPASIRFGSFGDNTLPAKGVLDEVVIWNRDVGANYISAAYDNRLFIPFGRPVPGVFLYAAFDGSPNAVGCGNKTFSYVGTVSNLDRLMVDMGKRTVTLWDDGSLTISNVIQNIDGGFFDVMPGINTFFVTKTGTGNVNVEISFIKRLLL